MVRQLPGTSSQPRRIRDATSMVCAGFKELMSGLCSLSPPESSWRSKNEMEMDEREQPWLCRFPVGTRFCAEHTHTISF